MKVYWLLLGLTLFMWYRIGSPSPSAYGPQMYAMKIRGNYSRELKFFFGVLTVLMGLRSGMMDTGTYIGMFKGYPIGLGNIQWSHVEKDKGFYFLSVFYKTYISDDYQGWLFVIALISCIAMGIAIHRYSSDVCFSCFLFIASTMFTYLMNGIRQFIVVSILFAFAYCFEENRFWKYLALVLVLYTIHNSALIMIPIYFLVKARPWSWQTGVLILGALGIGMGFDTISPAMDTAMQGSVYGEYSALLKAGTGVNVFRPVIAAIPVVISFFCRKQITRTQDKIIPIATNMSIINFALYIVAIFTSGMSIGRLTIYFDVYNLILMPWLINNVASRKDKGTLRACLIIGYIAFFYFQMVLTWNLSYVSDFFGLHIYS